jgi:hypothetical protein
MTCAKTTLHLASLLLFSGTSQVYAVFRHRIGLAGLRTAAQGPRSAWLSICARSMDGEDGRGRHNCR